MLRKLVPLAMLFLVPACFKAPHDAEYDRQNPNKIYIDGKIKNAVDLPVAGAEIKLDTDVWDTTNVEGFFVAESIDPGIYKLTITGSNPLYDTVIIDACSLWAGRVIEDTTFFFRRAVWDMENETNLLPRGWRGQIGIWAITPDPGNPQNRALGVIAKPPTDGYFGILVCDPVVNDFTYEVRVMPLSTNNPGWIAGIAFCYQNIDNYLYFGYGQNYAALHMVRSGGDSTLVHRPMASQVDQWRRITVMRAGPRIEISVDGQLIIEASTGPFPSGQIALFAFAEESSLVTFLYDDVWLEPSN